MYGPVLYEAYTPFAALLGHRDAERIAALAFDLLTAVLLFLLGNQLRSPALGVLAAYCWLAFPVTFYEDALGFNDGLVAASLVAVLLVARSPARRGALTAIAACGKLSPLALVPTLAAYRPQRRGQPSRDLLVFALALLGVSAVAFAVILLHTTPATFLSRTLGFQASREPSDSLWSALQYHYGSGHPWLISAGRVLHGLVVALAGALVILSYRLVRWTPAVPALAAACAAILIAVEASLGYYSYSYLLWVVPLVLVALLMPAAQPHPAMTSRQSSEPQRAGVSCTGLHELAVTKASNGALSESSVGARSPGHESGPRLVRNDPGLPELASLALALDSPRACLFPPIIIRVSGVRVPPPALAFWLWDAGLRHCFAARRAERCPDFVPKPGREGGSGTKSE